jgi:hypothetical protein
MEMSAIVTPRPLYPLNRRLGALQSYSGRFGEEKNILPLPEIEPRFLGSFRLLHLISLG